MEQWAWMKDGGGPVPENIQEQTRQRVSAHAEKILPGKASWIHVRFRSNYCYIDACEPNNPTPTRLVRLSWEGDVERWSLAFYTYSNEKYQSCVFGNGKPFGTPEEALQIGAVYLG